MAVRIIDRPTAGSGRGVWAGGRFRPVVWIAGAYLALMLAWALAPALFTSESPFDTDIETPLQVPSWEHWFGTDASGRDIYTRVVYGTQSSLAIGVGATALALSVAIVFGLASGLGGRLTDGAISRFLEIVLALPGMLVALLFIAMLGPGAATQIVAVAIGSAAGYARMIRGQVLAVKDSGYVSAAIALGHPPHRIVSHHIFPNAMRPLVVLGTMGVGQSIVWASSLSFLGLGVAPPAPEWGAMLNAGRDFVSTAWWLEVFPGLAIVGCTLAVTVVGRYLQQRLEGRLT
ncbi:ABC transporter permease [Mycolicibacterium senegalense]|uniref:ABC transporter permease n=1 Tax=Mycolicibacterium senegalense TaxID=1796 RepID=UPI001C999BE1|nr:ABC transporter permease [Mycolicibacterium senegalense]MCV7334882.1 ABC transporter permease [Mycolicibacterium senegalense]MDR7290032.1 peptide/nickel transport system permease protein [Mycolicibacterium senegalense]QZA26802.1 ABC transporter permease [Mycolicibacterium senegalense]